MKPEFPLRAVFDDGTEEIYNSEEEIEINLEWMDSEEDDSIKVFDNQGRLDRFKLEKLQLIIFELY